MLNVSLLSTLYRKLSPSVWLEEKEIVTLVHKQQTNYQFLQVPHPRTTHWSTLHLLFCWSSYSFPSCNTTVWTLWNYCHFQSTKRTGGSRLEKGWPSRLVCQCHISSGHVQHLSMSHHCVPMWPYKACSVLCMACHPLSPWKNGFTDQNHLWVFEQQKIK